MPSELRAEVVIAGGGLAGSAAAISLARAGRDVVLLEQTAGPEHKVCGEFLSEEALGYLNALGVRVETLGAVPIREVGFGGATRSLPFRAMSLTRRRLDEELLGTAARAGVKILRGERVQSLVPVGNGWLARRGDGSQVWAPTAFLATGKHDLHGLPRPAGKQGSLVAFKMYLRLAPAPAAALIGRVELFLFPGGYGGLQLVEDGTANLCFLIERAALLRISCAENSGRWTALLGMLRRQCPELGTRLEDARSMLERPLAITSIPYGYVRRSGSEGLWALGDQAAVIPSFTGDGMSIALHSGCLAAAMFLDGATAAQFQQRLHGEVAGQVSLSTWISRALVRPYFGSVLRPAARLCPALLGLVARQTRLSPVKGLLWGTSMHYNEAKKAVYGTDSG